MEGQGIKYISPVYWGMGPGWRAENKVYFPGIWGNGTRMEGQEIKYISPLYGEWDQDGGQGIKYIFPCIWGNRTMQEREQRIICLDKCVIEDMSCWLFHHTDFFYKLGRNILALCTRR